MNVKPKYPTISTLRALYPDQRSVQRDDQERVWGKGIGGPVNRKGTARKGGTRELNPVGRSVPRWGRERVWVWGMGEGETDFRDG